MVSQLQTVSRGNGIPQFNIGVGPVGAHIKQAGMLLDATGAIFAVDVGDKVSFNGGIGFDVNGRMRIASGFWLVFDGQAGNYVSTPSSPLNNVTGDIELEGDAALVWSDGGQILISKSTATGDQRGWRLRTSATRIELRYSTDGIDSITVASTVPHGFIDGERHVVTATRIAATGEVNFFIDGLLNDTVFGASGNLFASTADVELGSQNDGTAVNANGTIFSARALDGIGGTVAVNVNADDAITSPFTDPVTGAIWTINGNITRASASVASAGPGATPFDANGDLCVGGATNLIYMGVALAADGKVATI